MAASEMPNAQSASPTSQSKKMKIERTVAALVFALVAGFVIYDSDPDWVRDPVLVIAFFFLVLIVDALIGRYFRRRYEEGRKRRNGNRA